MSAPTFCLINLTPALDLGLFGDFGHSSRNGVRMGDGGRSNKEINNTWMESNAFRFTSRDRGCEIKNGGRSSSDSISTGKCTSDGKVQAPDLGGTLRGESKPQAVEFNNSADEKEERLPSLFRHRVKEQTVDERRGNNVSLRNAKNTNEVGFASARNLNLPKTSTQNISAVLNPLMSPKNYFSLKNNKKGSSRTEAGNGKKMPLTSADDSLGSADSSEIGTPPLKEAISEEIANESSTLEKLGKLCSRQPSYTSGADTEVNSEKNGGDSDKAQNSENGVSNHIYPWMVESRMNSKSKQMQDGEAAPGSPLCLVHSLKTRQNMFHNRLRLSINSLRIFSRLMLFFSLIEVKLFSQFTLS